MLLKKALATLAIVGASIVSMATQAATPTFQFRLPVAQSLAKAPEVIAPTLSLTLESRTLQTLRPGQTVSGINLNAYATLEADDEWINLDPDLIQWKAETPLPNGLTLSDKGFIRGAWAGAEGSASFTVTLTYGELTATATYTIQVVGYITLGAN